MKNQEFKEMYADLLSMNWKGKNVWEKICDNTLTAAPHFKGELFGENKNFKLMVVGRAVNGWEYDFNNCVSENDVLNERIKILEETMDALEAQIDVMLIEMQEENEMKDKLIKELEAQVFKDFIIKLINDKTHED